MTMKPSKALEYWIIVAGCLLAFISAFKPMAAIGYELETGLLVVGLIPYLIYSVAVVLWQGVVSVVHGIVLLLLHAWMVMSVRFIEIAGHSFSSELLVYGPLILSVALLPIAGLAMRHRWQLEEE